MKTGSLFEQAKKLAKRDDPNTSKMAAVSVVKSGLRETQHRKILEAMAAREKTYPNSTSREISAEIVAGFGVHYLIADNWVHKRIGELEKEGLIEFVEERLSTVGDTGKKVRAYKLRAKI